MYLFLWSVVEANLSEPHITYSLRKIVHASVLLRYIHTHIPGVGYMITGLTFSLATQDYIVLTAVSAAYRQLWLALTVCYLHLAVYG